MRWIGALQHVHGSTFLNLLHLKEIIAGPIGNDEYHKPRRLLFYSRSAGRSHGESTNAYSVSVREMILPPFQLTQNRIQDRWISPPYSCSDDHTECSADGTTSVHQE